MSARLVGWCSVVVALLAICPTIAAGADQRSTVDRGEPPSQERPRNVLLLYATPRLMPAVVTLDETIRSTLTARADGPVYFYTEYLDLTMFPGGEPIPELRALLKRKYGHVKLDLLVAAASSVLRVILPHRGDLFPGVPVVFVAVDRAMTRNLTFAPDVSGVWLDASWSGTLDMALALRPATRRAIVVSGAGVVDRVWLAEARRQLAPFQNRVEIDYVTDVAVADLVRRVAILPSDSVILMGAFTRDTTGQDLVSVEVVRRVVAAASVPVFGPSETYVGAGIVGGHVVSWELQGVRAAELAVRVLRGEHPPPAEGATNVHMFDARQLERWGMGERRLPPDSVVRFREPSLWSVYKWHIVGVIALIVTQGAFIAALLVNRARRRRAEEDARRQREELAHVLRVTTLGELTAALAHEINQPLTAIVTNANAALRLLRAEPAEMSSVAEALADIAGDGERAGRVIQRLRALLRREPTQRIPVDVNSLVEESVALMHADLARAGILVRLALGSSLPRVDGDGVQIQQVILNLVVNACEAIASAKNGPGSITIATGEPQRGRLTIDVRDSGVGVAEPELERIFEHFVSSKPHGLGMGLAISRSIVHAHDGRIWATRNADRGLTLHVELPARTARADAVASAHAIEAGAHST
ncbi:MAG TPA: ATP-binding protein [Methylomirabilota bacterium]|nr:ATP-binding protein [Methylomirabilota bacterium]